ncbi:hypothetical protein RHMOL_Rhmol03G0257000 [Rhododendron molle]|uniref:Uncharacterized protein n=1 Tax=Rhododendron molle TaxID=49168 RepID=A0ACC0PIX2_RHOML|nr:hypothetical protein RHMOL_Rhmol03G0257000 [Rhododendron molle]
MQEGGGPLSSSPPPPHPPTESLARRYNKVVWRTLLLSNLVLGGFAWHDVLEIVGRKVYDSQLRKALAPFKVVNDHVSVEVPLVQGIGKRIIRVYMLARAGKKERAAENRKARAKEPSTPVATTATSVPEEPLPSPPIIEPVKVREPIPEDQQRELFKWILEEKRKVKPKDREEKKRIDEEKALLKEFIRAKSIPSL